MEIEKSSKDRTHIKLRLFRPARQAGNRQDTKKDKAF